MVPAGAPAGLGPVSTGERSSYGVGRPEPRDGSRGRVSVDPAGTAGQTVRAADPARTIGAMRTLRVALVQFEARDDVDDNIARAAALADQAAVDADLVVLPEYVQYRGSDADGYRASARPVPGPTTAPFEAIARERGCWVLAGSHAEASADPARPYNTAVLIDRDGARRRDLSQAPPVRRGRGRRARGHRVGPGDARRPGGGRGRRRVRPRALDLLRPALPRAVPRPRAGRRRRCWRCPRCSPSARARPLGGAAAGPGDRERGLGHRGRRLRRRRAGRDPGLGPLDGRGPVGPGRRAGGDGARGSCGRRSTSTRSRRRGARSRRSRTGVPRRCRRSGRWTSWVGEVAVKSGFGPG